MKKFNIILPKGLLEEVRSEAVSQEMNVSELLRRFIKIGLLVARLSRDENTSFILKKGDAEREIIIL